MALHPPSPRLLRTGSGAPLSAMHPRPPPPVGSANKRRGGHTQVSSDGQRTQRSGHSDSTTHIADRQENDTKRNELDEQSSVCLAALCTVLTAGLPRSIPTPFASLCCCDVCCRPLLLLLPVVCSFLRPHLPLHSSHRHRLPPLLLRTMRPRPVCDETRDTPSLLLPHLPLLRMPDTAALRHRPAHSRTPPASSWRWDRRSRPSPCRLWHPTIPRLQLLAARTDSIIISSSRDSATRRVRRCCMMPWRHSSRGRGVRAVVVSSVQTTLHPPPQPRQPLRPRLLGIILNLSRTLTPTSSLPPLYPLVASALGLGASRRSSPAWLPLPLLRASSLHRDTLDCSRIRDQSRRLACNPPLVLASVVA